MITAEPSPRKRASASVSQLPAGRVTPTDRVFMVLKSFMRLDGGVHSLGEISSAAGLDDSTTARILAAGTQHGVFAKPKRGRYQLGLEIARIGSTAMVHRPLVFDSSDILDNLRRASGAGSTGLLTLSPIGPSRQATTLSIDPDLVGELDLPTGDALEVVQSLRVGASGRAIVAFLPREVAERIAHEHVPEGAGPGAIRDPERYLAALSADRDRGYSIGRQEYKEGWDTVAAPVWVGEGIFGAVMMLVRATAPTDPMYRERALTMEAAQQFSRRILEASRIDTSRA
jgi:DNA-binding IclR family transcriptional regulator